MRIIIPEANRAYSIDRMPPGAFLSVQGLPHERGWKLRFRAVRPDGRPSAWSGWFLPADDDIRLLWLAFDFDGGPERYDQEAE